MKKGYLFALATILLLLICADFYIKVICSNNSTSGRNYIDLYENGNLYRVNNIYLVTIINIVFGIMSVFLFLKFKYFAISKVITYTLAAIVSLLTFLNLFSLL